MFGSRSESCRHDQMIECRSIRRSSGDAEFQRTRVNSVFCAKSGQLVGDSRCDEFSHWQLSLRKQDDKLVCSIFEENVGASKRLLDRCYRRRQETFASLNADNFHSDQRQ